MWTKIIWDADIRELTAPARWVFVTLLALAAEGAGMIKGASASCKYLANAAEVDQRTLSKSLTILRQKCLIDVAENGSITIPNWHKYQSTTEEREARKKRGNPALEQNRREENRTDKKYRVIFDAWIAHPNIRPKHVKLTTGMEKAINARLSDGYTVEQICQSINNYGDSTKDFWAKRRSEGLWTLDLFLSRGEGAKGLGRFLEGPINEKTAYTGQVGGGRSFIKR